MRSYLPLLREVVGFLRWRFPALIALMALVGISEGFSVTLLLPLLSRMGIGATAKQDMLSAWLDRAIEFISPSAGPLTLLGIVAVVATLQAALFIALNWWTTGLVRRYQRHRQSQMFSAFIRAKWTFLVDRKSGELTNAIVNESLRLAQAFSYCLYLISASVVALIYLIFAFLVAWPIAATLIVVSLLMTLSVTKVYRKSMAVGRSISPLNSELQTALGEFLSGAKIVKSTTSESRAEARVDYLARKLEYANHLANFLPNMVRALCEFLAFIFLATILVFGKEGFGIGVGNIIVVIALFVRLFPRVSTVQVYIHQLNSNLPSIETINSLVAAAQAEAEPAGDGTGGLPLTLPTALVVRGLTVTLGGRDVLDSVDLRVAMPGMVGVIGGSGAGKSTLVHAVLGLVPVGAGSISLGSHDLTSAPLPAWRRAIGYVPQETMLFHASVRDNLAFADPDASDADVAIAARRAHAHEFINALPQGYHTIIGDQGVRLSGGQRQRLGIARALLTNPKLLILDEAMSALDAEAEAMLVLTLEELRTEMGILMITHRLAAVRNADLICVLEAGRIVEAGSWNELIAGRSRLHALLESQQS
jgi:ATP-binding cassette subfamily C protein